MNFGPPKFCSPLEILDWILTALEENYQGVHLPLKIHKNNRKLRGKKLENSRNIYIAFT